MGRFLRPLAATLVLAGSALIGQIEPGRAIEPPPPLPTSSGQLGTPVVNLPAARPAAGASTAAPAVQAGPTVAPATAAMTSNREILLELGKRQISLVDNGRVVGSWPVAVGDPSTPTPTGRFKVRNKVVNPQYQSTKSGKNNPTIGPQGPLGDRWIGFHTTERDQFGIHGTPTAWEWTVKSRSAVSHGCVRMLTPHVRQLFDQVDVGTPVVVKP
jgi:lipoprotein-anchoring transpeptidase ErfK/SrfK